MPSFLNTVRPTPFGFFDSDTQFQQEADGVVLWVKRRLGDDVLSVELTNKMIWACFEEAALEYGRIINDFAIRSQLTTIMGMPTGSNVNLSNINPQQTLEFLMRLAEPYANASFVGGNQDTLYCYFDLEVGRQEYDMVTELKLATTLSGSATAGSLAYDAFSAGHQNKLRVVDIFHFSPVAAQQFLLNASNITNFLATNFNYESYVNSTIFYVLPVFEDVLRRGMLETAFRVRRSNYSYELRGKKLRIYPIPTQYTADLGAGRLYIRVAPPIDPMGITGLPGQTTYPDDQLYGVSGPHNAPFQIIPFSTMNQPGKQWIRQYTLALCMYVLGLVRGKFDTVPIPNADLKLNGEQLQTQAREDKEKLIEYLKENLAELTHDKLLEKDAAKAESVQKMLKMIPMPAGKSIVCG